MTKTLLVGAVLFAPVVAQAAPKVECDTFKPKRMTIAKAGDFQVQSGLANAKMPGYVGQAPLTFSGCTLPELKLGDVVLIEFDAGVKKNFIATDYDMQCVDSKSPNGKFLSYDAAPKFGDADGAIWTAPCSATNLNATERANCVKTEDKSERYDAFNARMAKSKTVAFQLYISEEKTRYELPGEVLIQGGGKQSTVAAEVAPSGVAFCQAYNIKTKKVLFAYTFKLPETTPAGALKNAGVLDAGNKGTNAGDGSTIKENAKKASKIWNKAKLP